MGLYDRDYTQAGERRQYFGSGQVRFRLPQTASAVTWLLIINIAIFVLEWIIPSLRTSLEGWFAADASSWQKAAQVWRLVSYQFLHAARFDHLFFNMLGLFFFAPMLERHWGKRRFLVFYLSCGVAGGLVYLLLAAVGVAGHGVLVGASGAILGVLAACALLFPQQIIFLYFFPVPIRVGAILFILLAVVNMVRGQNAGGEAAHLGGMAAGAGYVLLLPMWERLKLRTHSQSWEKRLEESRRLRFEVDRILAKVHRFGLHSLTGKEKRMLKKATQEEIRRHEL